MSQSHNLNDILEDLKFTEKEAEGFVNALETTREYYTTGEVDLEKQFTKIVEKVALDEIQEN